MIQSTKTEVVIRYNKLNAEPKQGKSLDNCAEEGEAQNGGEHEQLNNLSRAILCNDSQIKKLDELQITENMY